MKFAQLTAAAVAAVGMMFTIAGCGASESDICDTAKQLISEKCAEMNPENPATCVSVELTKKVSDDCWTAKAKLDNGTVVPITIKLHDDDRIEVDFSAWLGKEIEKAFDDAAKELENL